MSDYEDIVNIVKGLCNKPKPKLIKPKIAPHANDDNPWTPKAFESKWARDIFYDSEPGIREFLNEVTKL